MDLELWKKKRRRTLYTYLLCSCIMGMEYNLVLVTIIPYLENLVKTDRSQMYYGLCISIRYFVAMIADVIIGRLVDRTRNVKLSVFMCTLFGIIGNLVYSVYLSPIFLVAGRAITGVTDSVFSLLIGEIMRTYDEDQATRVLWFLFAACSAGYTTGSLISILFTDINFKIGSLMINQHNFVGVFLASSFAVNVVIVCVFAHDCSKEYDIKAAQQEKNEHKENFQKETCVFAESNGMRENSPLLGRRDVTPFTYNSTNDGTEHKTDILVHDGSKEFEETATHQHQHQHEIIAKFPWEKYSLTASNNSFRSRASSKHGVHCSGSHEHGVRPTRRFAGSISDSIICQQSLYNPSFDSSVPTICIILRYFVSHLQILLIMFSTFAFAYVLHTMDLFGPLLILHVYKWSDRAVNIVCAVHCVAYFFLELILSIYCITNRRVYGLTVLCIVLMIVCLSFILCMTSLDLSETNKLILLVAYLVTYIPVWTLDEVTTSNLLARMVPSRTQCFAEAVRSGLSRASCILASLTISIELELKYWACAMIALVEIFLLFYLLTNKRLRNIQTIEF